MTAAAAVLILTFIVLLTVGVPVVFSMLGASVAALIVMGDVPWTIIATRTVTGVDSFVLLAVPLFILAGMIMDAGGVSARLMTLAEGVMGRIHGGLPISVVGASMLNSGLTGSVIGDVAAMTAVAHPGMVRAGYDKTYSLSVIASASAFGILIPPSVTAVVLGGMAGVPVTTLFVAALVPAVVLGAVVMALIYAQARYGNAHPLGQRSRLSREEMVRSLKVSAWALGVPAIIFGGIFAGVATVTEIAAFAVVYTLFISVVVFRQMRIRDFYRLLYNCVVATGSVIIMLGFATIFSFVLEREGVPRAVATAIIESGMPAWVFLLISCLIFVFIGSIVDGFASLIIFVPIFLPIANTLGVDPVHYLTVTILASGIGLLLPPAGMGMLLACGIGKVKIEEMIRPYAPFLMVKLMAILILIVFPALTLALPLLLGMPGL